MEVRLHEHIQFEDRHVAVTVLHSCQDMRVLLINLLPGQCVEPHSSSSSVSLQVIAGAGEIFTNDAWVVEEPGTLRFYEPNQPHGVRAVAEPMTILATIAPLP